MPVHGVCSLQYTLFLQVKSSLHLFLGLSMYFWTVSSRLATKSPHSPLKFRSTTHSSNPGATVAAPLGKLLASGGYITDQNSIFNKCLFASLLIYTLFPKPWVLSEGTCLTILHVLDVSIIQRSVSHDGMINGEKISKQY